MRGNNYIVILVGVCGTGKSNIGQKVANTLNVPFFDADQLPVFQELPDGKIPQDIDLDKWLNSLQDLIIEQSTQKGCVISCSVLRREHRKMLASNIDFELDWVFMKDSYENAVERSKKEAHGRPASVLESDFNTLEAPKRALTIDMSNSEQDMVDIILKYLARKYW